MLLASAAHIFPTAWEISEQSFFMFFHPLTSKRMFEMLLSGGKCLIKKVSDIIYSWLKKPNVIIVTHVELHWVVDVITCPSSQFCLWTDGLSVLLGRDMSSESMRSELEILLSMEIKLRLLDLENVPIPDSAPVVPKPPSNYNFCYDFSQTEQ